MEKPGLTAPTGVMSDIVSHPNPCALAQKIGLPAKDQRGQEASRKLSREPGTEQQTMAKGEGSYGHMLATEYQSHPQQPPIRDTRTCIRMR